MPEAETMRPGIVLAAYLEPLLDGRRVLVFGEATSGLAEMLLERGARLVHVCDPDPARAHEAAARSASRNVSYAPLSDGGLALREGAFDVGVVEDLGAAGPASSVLKRLRRALSPRGVALVAVPNPDVRARLLPTQNVVGALDYYQLYDAVKAEFPHVRMLGQTAFVGFAIVDFASSGAPDPSLDTAFVPGGAEEPEWFLAFASALPIRLDEFSVVQLPLASVRGATRPQALEEEVGHSREAERRARERSARLEAELEELRQQLSRERVTFQESRDDRNLQRELEKRDAWIKELEARAAVADARADEAQAEVEELRKRPQVDPAQEQRIAELTRELETLRAEAASQSSDSSEVDDLEARLRERGNELRRLEAELREAERVGKSLLGDAERLAEINARREADLEAARWTIQTLSGGATSEADAEAELQRQAVLLAQVGRS
jgi:SAM-dependent methyltransferase